MFEMIKQVARNIGPLHRYISRARGSRIHEPELSAPSQLRLGTVYGGWSVLPELLDAYSVVYAVGVGTDISFDLELIRRFGCTVHAFDPTPISLAWIEEQDLPPQFVFHAIGLGGKDGQAEFHAPAVEGHASFSLAGTASSGTSVHCPIRTLSSLMSELGHDHIDLLKMDIEGFEYPVIDDILASDRRPRQLQVEFHHNMYNHSQADTNEAVEKLRGAGYRLFSVSNTGHEYGFRFDGA